MFVLYIYLAFLPFAAPCSSFSTCEACLGAMENCFYVKTFEGTYLCTKNENEGKYSIEYCEEIPFPKHFLTHHVTTQKPVVIQNKR